MLYQCGSGGFHLIAAPAADVGSGIFLFYFPDKITAMKVATGFAGNDVIFHIVK